MLGDVEGNSLYIDGGNVIRPKMALERKVEGKSGKTVVCGLAKKDKTMFMLRGDGLGLVNEFRLHDGSVHHVNVVFKAEGDIVPSISCDCAVGMAGKRECDHAKAVRQMAVGTLMVGLIVRKPEEKNGKKSKKVQ